MDNRLTRLFFLLLLGATWLLPVSQARTASTAEKRLARAEREFKNLQKNRSRQRYRHNYTNVEGLYRKVFEGHPGTREAARALLACGELFTLLHRWNSSFKDLDQARDYYRQLVADYPGGSYADDGQIAIAFLYLNYYNDPVQAYREFEKVESLAPRGNKVSEAKRWLKKLSRYRPQAAEGAAPQSPSRGASSLFSAAEKKFAALKKSTSRQRYRHNYENTAKAYRKVFEGYPSSMEAKKSLLRSGEIYSLLYKWTKSKSDLGRARSFYQRLIDDYAAGDLTDDAQIAIAYLYLDQYDDPSRAYTEFQKVSWLSPQGDRRAEADRQLAKLKRYKPRQPQVSAPSAPIPSVLARVRGIRHWSNPAYTRVVIDLDRQTNFYSNLLRESSKDHKPPRLYIDLFNALAESALRNTIPVNDGILSSIRTGQFTADTVRVVLDIEKLKSYNIFPMENPFRIVIDATGGGRSLPPRPPAAAAPSPTAPREAERYSLAQQLGLGIRKIVIDPGHGAHDPGAIGVGGLKEKDVTLDLALRMKKLLQAEGLEVVLTRDRDFYLGLAERTAIANESHADLFLSLHANSSRRSNLRGVETYFLNLASSERAMETAAKENSMAVARMADLENIIQEIFNSKQDESNRLAGMVQKRLIWKLRRHYRDVKDLGVKQAPFYVLIGAQMPSILAEVSFINHPVEGKRLSKESYRQHLAEALTAGIADYIRSVKVASAGQ